MYIYTPDNLLTQNIARCDECRRLKEKCEGGIPCRRCAHFRRPCESKALASRARDFRVYVPRRVLSAMWAQRQTNPSLQNTASQVGGTRVAGPMQIHGTDLEAHD